MLVGIPGSGKSTFAKNQYGNYKILSSDEFRKILGDENDQSKNDLVFKMMFTATVEALKNGESVVYDATNLTSKRRKNLITRLKQYEFIKDCKFSCYIMVCDFNECIKRQDYRERKVPTEIIYKMLKQFEVPTRYEGWNEIKCIQTSNLINLDLIMFKYHDMPHDNPNHTLSIYEHMVKAYEIYNSQFNFDDPYLRYAVKYHDIGKYYTKFFKDDGIAHFYGHQNFGAYLMLCSDCIPSFEFKLRAALYIQHHMDYYLMPEEKLEEKLKPILQIDKKYLDIIHTCDMLAH